MNDYRFIADLRGPQGEPGTGGPAIALTADDDLDALGEGEYRVSILSVAEALGTPNNMRGTLSVRRVGDTKSMQQVYTTFSNPGPSVILTRQKQLTGDYDDWEQMAVQSELNAAIADGGASVQILDLARRDGWLEVYNPGDRANTDITSEGRVSAVRGGLGNLPDMTAPDGYEPRLLRGEFGQLSGVQGESGRRLRVVFDNPIPQPATVLVLGRNTGVGAPSAQRMLIDGIHSSARWVINTGSAGQAPYRIFAGHVERGDEPSDTQPHLFEATFDGARSSLLIDGRSSRHGLTETSTHESQGITLGADSNTNRPWEGSAGLVLIYPGVPSPAVLGRMRRLVMSAAGISHGVAKHLAGTRVFTVSESGKVYAAHGDPDQISRHGIASMTKVMTAYVARQTLTSNALLDEEITVEASDEWLPSDQLKPGDVITYRDLLYGLALPSWNAAGNIVARGVGEKLLAAESATGDGYLRFIQEMDRTAVNLGYRLASFHQPGGGGKMSARNMVDLMQRAMQDNALRTVFGSSSHTITVGGDNARSIAVSHTIADNSPAPIPGFIAGKTGTSNGYGHVVVTWEHPDGTEYTTVIMETDSDDTEQRYHELQAAITDVTNGGPHSAGTAFASGDTQLTTGIRDITDSFDGVTQGRITLMRSATTVTLNFVAVRLPAGSYSGAIAPGFRPGEHAYDNVTHGERPTSTVAQVQITPVGTVQLHSDGEGTLRGTITWQVTSLGFPEAPFPGIRA